MSKSAKRKRRRDLLQQQLNGRGGDPSPARSKGEAKRQQPSRKKSGGRAAKLNAAMSKRDKKITQQRKELARLRGDS